MGNKCSIPVDNKKIIIFFYFLQNPLIVNSVWMTALMVDPYHFTLSLMQALFHSQLNATNLKLSET